MVNRLMEHSNQMHPGNSSVSCVPHSKDNLFYGWAALMSATSTMTARRKFSLILTDKEIGILQNRVSCQVEFLQMCMHIFSFPCRGHVKEHYISPNHFLNFTANQNDTSRQRMNAGLISLYHIHLGSESKKYSYLRSAHNFCAPSLAL